MEEGKKNDFKSLKVQFVDAFSNLTNCLLNINKKNLLTLNNRLDFQSYMNKIRCLERDWIDINRLMIIDFTLKKKHESKQK